MLFTYGLQPQIKKEELLEVAGKKGKKGRCLIVDKLINFF
jgi:hypothetical protein